MPDINKKSPTMSLAQRRKQQKRGIGRSATQLLPPGGHLGGLLGGKRELLLQGPTGTSGTGEEIPGYARTRKDRTQRILGGRHAGKLIGSEENPTRKASIREIITNTS